MYESLLYHRKHFHPVISLTGTNPEALIAQARGYADHYAFAPRKLGTNFVVRETVQKAD